MNDFLLQNFDVFVQEVFFVGDVFFLHGIFVYQEFTQGGHKGNEKCYAMTFGGDYGYKEGFNYYCKSVR